MDDVKTDEMKPGFDVVSNLSFRPRSRGHRFYGLEYVATRGRRGFQLRKYVVTRP